MPSLSMRDLTISYSSGGYVVTPIDGLSLDVKGGELVLLLGASGCGKTTLLSAVASILQPASGSITFDGREVIGLRGTELLEYRRRSIGIVFQAFNLIPSLSASENVQIPMRAIGTRRAQARERADSRLKRVGLENRLDHLPGQLSGGEQQRVAIARALANDPRILLADEPTAHLDYIQVEGVLMLLREITSPERIVMIATHDERLLPLADRVVELTPRKKPRDERPHLVSLTAGEVLFEQGDPGDWVYVVESGEVEIYRVRADGSEETLTRVRPGGYFGELAPMFGLRRSASARAVDATRLVAHGVDEFRTNVAPILGR